MGLSFCKEEVGPSFKKYDYSVRSNLKMVERVNKNVMEDYEIVDVIGKGSISTIASVRSRNNGSDDAIGCFGLKISTRGRKPKEDIFEEVEAVRKSRGKGRNIIYALKAIDLSHIREDYIEELRNEVTILRTLDHPNIVKAFEVYEYRSRISVIMELCSGGDLYTRVPYSETQARRIAYKILSAICYMHSKNVSHRDIKYENIMFESEDPNAEVKLIDFGLAKKYLPSKDVMKERVGTLYTMAPEVIKGIYTAKADMWSVGVVAFMLLSSEKPFWGSDGREIIENIMNCNYTAKKSTWKKISKKAKHFISHLIEYDTDKRYSAIEAIESPWIDKGENLRNRASTSELSDETSSLRENFAKYMSVSEFKKLALMIIAHKSTPQDILQCRELFETMDEDHTGKISFEEFRHALSTSQTPLANTGDLADLFKGADVIGDGVINYTEFLAATLETQGKINEDRILEAFHHFDTDDSGFITDANLKQLLGERYSAEQMEQMMIEVDHDKDGKISFDDFLNIFRMKEKKRIKEFKSSLSSISGEEDKKV